MLTFALLVLILGLISVALQVTKKVIRQRRCVSDENLHDYFYGKLKKRNPQGYEDLIAHLGICEDCQQRLVELTNPGTDKDLEDHLVE